MVAFVIKYRVALTLGDPIGPLEDAQSAIEEFQSHCEKNDWIPAFYQVLPDYLEKYRALGFIELCIGHEGIVDLSPVSEERVLSKGLRSTVNRLTKHGYRTELHPPPQDERIMDQLRSISDEWLTMVRGREKRFSLGWFDYHCMKDSPVMAVHNPAGDIIAFTDIVPEYQLNEVTVNLMRRRQEVENGTMDFLFVALLRWAREAGYAAFSLGLSPLAGVGEKPEDPAVERALHYIYDHLNQFYNFKGLHAFKEKFHPAWEPRYLVRQGKRSLPAVMIALIRAGSGDGFLWKYFQERCRSATKTCARPTGSSKSS